MRRRRSDSSPIRFAMHVTLQPAAGPWRMPLAFMPAATVRGWRGPRGALFPSLTLNALPDHRYRYPAALPYIYHHLDQCTRNGFIPLDNTHGVERNLDNVNTGLLYCQYPTRFTVRAPPTRLWTTAPFAHITTFCCLWTVLVGPGSAVALRSIKFGLWFCLH